MALAPLVFLFASWLSWHQQHCSATDSHHRPQIKGSKWSRTENYDVISQNQAFDFLKYLSQQQKLAKMGPFCSFIDSHLKSGIRLFSLQEALVPFSRNSILDNNPGNCGYSLLSSCSLFPGLCSREVESHKFIELSLVQIQDDQLFAYPYHVHFSIS